jgi:hypothetical protein
MFSSALTRRLVRRHLYNDIEFFLRSPGNRLIVG